VKLLIYSHFFAPSIGGVQSIVLSLARGLAELPGSNGAREFEITLVTQDPRGDYDDSALPFRVVRQPGLFELWRLIRRSDLVHSAGPSLAPAFLGFLSRKPVVIEHHGYQAICPNGVLLHQPDGGVCRGYFQARQYLECWRCQNIQISRVQSLLSLLLMFPRSWLAHKASTNIGITKHVVARHALPRSLAVYYGVPEPLGENLPPAPDKNVHRKLCFAYVGRLVPEKGIPILLEAARLLSAEGHQFEVQLIGDGPERARLEAILIKDHLQSRVRITGYLSGSALADALDGVRVVVMPSVWEETAGLAAIEHMMRGKLVIASDIGGLGEIIEDAGLKCQPGNAQALAKCMLAVLQDPCIIESFGQKARDRALRLFRTRRMIEDHARVYREVLRNSIGDA
jgi:glycosyltransferase involved in cell wall biosynthesis